MFYYNEVIGINFKVYDYICMEKEIFILIYGIKWINLKK